MCINDAPFVGGVQISLRIIIIRQVDSRRPLARVAIPRDRQVVGEFFLGSGAEIAYVPIPRVSLAWVERVARLIRTTRHLWRLVQESVIDIIHTNAQRGGMIGLMPHLVSVAKSI